jgi:uncharacterized protein DUF1648
MIQPKTARDERLRKLPIVLFLALLAAAAWRATVLADRLPDVVAVHFDASGHPDGFATRDACREFMHWLTLGTPAFIVLVTSLIPRMIPPAMINIPNRDYWLAPQRAEESLSFLGLQGVWFGCIFLVFLAGIDELIVEANSVSPAVLPTARFVTALALLAAAVAIWAARMFRRFRRPDWTRGA